MSILWKKYCWSLGIIFIFSLNLVCAINEEIVFDYPINVNYGENFSVNLTLINFSLDVYDVKIEIFNSSNDRLSQIYDNGTWKSTYYYLNDIINTSTTNSSLIMLNITSKYNGTAVANITLRDSSPTQYKFSGYYININYTEKNNTQNLTQNETEIESNIYLELDYDDKIENGEDFDVRVKAYNLKDKNYDIKVYLTKEDSEEIISESYINKTWKSSNYYYNNIISGIGNKTKTITLRIDSDYSDFKGDAKIKARIRENEKTLILAYVEGDIKIIEKKINNKTTITNTNITNKNTTIQNITEDIIKLNTIKEDLKTIKSKTYLSKTEYIKEYSIYFFTLFCVFVLIYILKKR